MIKSRRLRWAGHVARMEEGTSAFKILDGRTLLEWALNIGINTSNGVDYAQVRHCICICFDGVAIAAQCTATFLRSIVLPRI